MRVRGACDKPFWIYMRLNNCAAPAPDSDDVLVVEEEVFLCAEHAKEATTKTSSLSGAGAAQLFNRLYIQNGVSHAPRTFTIQLMFTRVVSLDVPNHCDEPVLPIVYSLCVCVCVCVCVCLCLCLCVPYNVSNSQEWRVMRCRTKAGCRR